MTDFPAPPVMAVTVDLVVLSMPRDDLVVLTIRRGLPPFAGRLALPGGFVGPDESLDEAAARELTEETGLIADPDDPTPGGVRLEQFGGYGDPGRDPRGRVVTIAYLALVPGTPAPHAGSDAIDAAWLPVDALLSGSPSELAFDHRRILADGVTRFRAGARTPRPTRTPWPG